VPLNQQFTIIMNVGEAKAGSDIDNADAKRWKQSISS
jgi:hypothetical protein